MPPPQLHHRHYPPSGSLVTEDTPPDLLEGCMDLQVTLPKGNTVMMNVHRSTPMMDLLIHVTTSHRIPPAGHVINVLSDNRLLSYKPSTPIGALDCSAIAIVARNKKNESARNRKSNLQQQVHERNIRLKVNLPHGQLAVYRLPPSTPMGEILSMVCRDKNLDEENHEIRHPVNVDERLRSNCSLSDYQLNEVVVSSKDFRPPVLSVTDLLTMSSIAHTEDKKRRGFLGIFGRRAKSSTGDSSLSSGSAGERSVSPARSDDSVDDSRPLSANALSTRSLTNTSNVAGSGQLIRPVSMISLSKGRKRLAPKPPNAANGQVNVSTIHERNSNLSRHSSDSSGYHEQRSSHVSPSTSEVSGVNPRAATLPPHSNLTMGQSQSMLSLASRTRRKAPLPPQPSMSAGTNLPDVSSRNSKPIPEETDSVEKIVIHEEAKSIDSKSIDSKSIDSKSIDSKSIDSKSIDSKSIDSKSIDIKSIDIKSIDSKVIDSKSIESIDSKPLESKSIDIMSEDIMEDSSSRAQICDNIPKSESKSQPVEPVNKIEKEIATDHLNKRVETSQLEDNISKEIKSSVENDVPKTVETKPVENASTPVDGKHSVEDPVLRSSCSSSDVSLSASPLPPPSENDAIDARLSISSGSDELPVVKGLVKKKRKKQKIPNFSPPDLNPDSMETNEVDIILPNGEIELNLETESKESVENYLGRDVDEANESGESIDSGLYNMDTLPKSESNRKVFEDEYMNFESTSTLKRDVENSARLMVQDVEDGVSSHVEKVGDHYDDNDLEEALMVAEAINIAVEDSDRENGFVNLDEFGESSTDVIGELRPVSNEPKEIKDFPEVGAVITKSTDEPHRDSIVSESSIESDKQIVIEELKGAIENQIESSHFNIEPEPKSNYNVILSMPVPKQRTLLSRNESSSSYESAQSTDKPYAADIKPQTLAERHGDIEVRSSRSGTESSYDSAPPPIPETDVPDSFEKSNSNFIIERVLSSVQSSGLSSGKSSASGSVASTIDRSSSRQSSKSDFSESDNQDDDERNKFEFVRPRNPVFSISTYKNRAENTGYKKVQVAPEAISANKSPDTSYSPKKKTSNVPLKYPLWSAFNLRKTRSTMDVSVSEPKSYNNNHVSKPSGRGDGSSNGGFKIARSDSFKMDTYKSEQDYESRITGRRDSERDSKEVEDDSKPDVPLCIQDRKSVFEKPSSSGVGGKMQDKRKTAFGRGLNRINSVGSAFNLRKAKSTADVRGPDSGGMPAMGSMFAPMGEPALTGEYMKLQDDFLKWQQQLMDNQNVLHTRVAPIASQGGAMNNQNKPQMVQQNVPQQRQQQPQQQQQQQQQQQPAQRKPREINIPIRFEDDDDGTVDVKPVARITQPEVRQAPPAQVYNNNISGAPSWRSPPNVQMSSWGDRPELATASINFVPAVQSNPPNVRQPKERSPAQGYTSVGRPNTGQVVYQSPEPQVNSQFSQPQPQPSHQPNAQRPQQFAQGTGFQRANEPVPQRMNNQASFQVKPQPSIQVQPQPSIQVQSQPTYQAQPQPTFQARPAYQNQPQQQQNYQPPSQPTYQPTQQTYHPINQQGVQSNNQKSRVSPPRQVHNNTAPPYVQNSIEPQVQNFVSKPSYQQPVVQKPLPESKELNQQNAFWNELHNKRAGLGIRDNEEDDGSQVQRRGPSADRDDGLNTRFTSVVTLSNDGDQAQPQKDKVKSVVQLNSQDDNATIANAPTVRGFRQPDDSTYAAPMSSRLVQAVQSPGSDSSRASPPKGKHTPSPPPQFSVPNLRHVPSSEPARVSPPRYSPSRASPPSNTVNANIPGPPPPPPPPCAPMPPPPPPAPGVNSATRTSTGKRIVPCKDQPQLDSRQELMMEIRNFGGSGHLKRGRQNFIQQKNN